MMIAMALLAAGLAVLVAAGPAAAAEVKPGGGALARAVAAAAPGDTLRLAPGDHVGGIVIDKALSLVGQPGARIVGSGEGRVLTFDAPGILLRGLTVTGSGLKLETEDSGVFATKRATGARIESNRLEDNLIGVYLKGARDAIVKDNVILGRRDLRMNERGNGVQIWNAPGAVVDGNDIRYGRDGIFVTTSKQNTFRRNRFRNLRFGIHYMYTNNSEVSDNRSIDNHVGYAIMYSHGLEVRGNSSVGDRDHGLLLNYANRAEIVGNRVNGPHKCVFIYNANKNAIHGNHFEGCEIGIHFTAGSERNQISGNSFVANRTQVKYVGTQEVEWSQDRRGNYWSDNLAFDLDGDGLADAPYHPNGLVDQIVWRHPLAKLLLNSPATQILRWAQSAFPALRPGGVTDSHPLMAPEP
ncbi:MAG: nitrous oxide reductase family maturation protein NosD [Pseudomonadota bacterium]